MIYLLLVIYQLKHFICDFLLQGKYMLGKFKGGNEWILPLAAHAGVHGVATFLIALCFKPKSAFLIALFDMVVHFTMDRIKASPNMLGRFKPLTAETYVVAVQTNDTKALKAALRACEWVARRESLCTEKVPTLIPHAKTRAQARRGNLARPPAGSVKVAGLAAASARLDREQDAG